MAGVILFPAVERSLGPLPLRGLAQVDEDVLLGLTGDADRFDQLAVRSCLAGEAAHPGVDLAEALVECSEVELQGSGGEDRAERFPPAADRGHERVEHALRLFQRGLHPRVEPRRERSSRVLAENCQAREPLGHAERRVVRAESQRATEPLGDPVDLDQAVRSVAQPRQQRVRPASREARSRSPTELADLQHAVDRSPEVAVEFALLRARLS